jgi:hypothetical protein
VTAQSASAEIRLAGPADVEAICALLEQSFPRYSVPFWRGMLAYPWLAAGDKPDLGAVVAVGSEVRGFFGGMYSDRTVDGRTERFCNIFGWCVHPDFRRYSIPLLAFLVRRPGLTFVNVTAGDELVTMFTRLGFALADERMWVSYPTMATALAARGRRAHVIQDDDVGPASLDADAYRMYRDHQGRTVTQLVFEADGETCLVVFKRRFFWGYRGPRTELYHASNRAFLQRHFEQIKFRLLSRDKSIALHADERLLGFVPAGARQMPAKTLFKSSTVPASAIDQMYTELVILP